MPYQLYDPINDSVKNRKLVVISYLKQTHGSMVAPIYTRKNIMVIELHLFNVTILIIVVIIIVVIIIVIVIIAILSL